MTSSIAAVAAVTALTAALALSAPAHAAQDGAGGFALAGALALGLAAGAAPYLAARDRNDLAPASISMVVGAGGHLDAYVLGGDLGGYLRRDGLLGWMGRARFELVREKGSPASGTAARFDSFALLRLAGAADGPLLLEATPGLTIWPRIETTAADKTTAYAGIGPMLGLRFRARSASPRIYSEVEADYAPLLGAPPSGHTHHIELGSTLGFTPWSEASGLVAFELRARFEVAVDSPDLARTAGISLLGGVRFRLDLLDKLDRARPASATPHRRTNEQER